jgi:hypothetical protein
LNRIIDLKSELKKNELEKDIAPFAKMMKKSESLCLLPKRMRVMCE